MDEREMLHIGSLYDDNYAQAMKLGLSQDKMMRLAMIATVVDILRADARKDEKDKERETVHQVTVATDINLLGMEYPRLPLFLQQLGCRIVEDLEGYRIVWKVDGYYMKIASYALRIKGRFALLDKSFTNLDMEQLKDAYKKAMDKELPHYCDVNFGDNT